MCLGIPGQIVGVADAAAMLMTVDVCGVRRSVDVVCIADPDRPIEALVGAWVLVHVGFAMSVVDEAEAAATLRVLSEIGEAAGELAAIRDGSVDLPPASA